MRVLSGQESVATSENGVVSAGRPRERGVSASERRRMLAQELQEQREDEVLDLHTHRSEHYIDNAFSLVTANMAIVSFVLGCVYLSRECDKPLAGFLIILGLLAPFAACLPVLVRQWFYLHLRLKNVVTVLMFAATAFYVVWLLVGQSWAFASSAKTCDQDLSTAANVVVFVLYLMLLMYAAKIVWYLLARARYSYKQLCLSCFRDPYPNALEMTDAELDHLDAEMSQTPPNDDDDDKHKPQKNRTLLDIQRHQHDLRLKLHSIFQSRTPHATPATAAKVKPVAKPKPKSWSLDFSKPPRRKRGSKSSSTGSKRSVAPMNDGDNGQHATPAPWSLSFQSGDLRR